MSLVNRSGIHGLAGRLNEQLADCREVVERFGSTASAEIQRQVAFALCNMASVLDGTGRGHEAEEVRSQLFARFGASSDSAVAKAIAIAIENRSPARGGGFSAS